MRWYPLFRPFIHRLDPEVAHGHAIRALETGVIPPAPAFVDPRLTMQVCGLTFANPVGLAAGFDKDARAVKPLLRQGFGFVEAGTVTPLPQAGNPTPRLFRLEQDRAAINRLGFNNQGLGAFTARLSRLSNLPGIVGANIGKNKDSTDAIADYVSGLEQVYPYCDYVTVNVSSPNTPGLRNLQEKRALFELMQTVMRTRDELASRQHVKRPLFVKLAPDIDDSALEGIAQVLVEQRIDGILLTNTTIARPETLKSTLKQEQGGLSGAPLFARSTEVLARMYRLTEGRMPLIGVGGIFSAEDAFAKIRAGASLVQIYTVLAYEGFGVVRTINEGLVRLLDDHGFATLKDAVGTAA